MAEVSFGTLVDGKVAVRFPYTEEAKDRIKALGSKWDSRQRAWLVPEAFTEDARQIMFDIFGTDGEKKVKKVSLTVKTLRDLKAWRAPVVCAGKVLARAWGRDSGAKVGEDVALIDGKIRSSGSRNNWSSWVEVGSIFKLVNVFPNFIDKIDLDDFEILTSDESVNPLAGFSDGELLAEITRRGLVTRR